MLGCLLLAVSWCGCALRAEISTVLLVSIDTLRADRLGAYGGRAVPTPAMDALGAQSAVFDTAWSTTPLTLPAHASMLTGLLTPRHGLRVNGVHRLPDEVPLVQESFARAGWATGAFVGGFPLERRFGLDRGFDTYDDAFPREASPFQYPERRGAEVVAAATAWLKRQRPERRVFLFVHLYDPHAEYRPPSPYAERFAENPYDGEVAYVDAVVGELLESLRSAGRWSRTVALLVADHGEALGEHGEDTHGLLLHEATLRVPFLLRVPGLAAGRRSTPVSLADVAPTLLARASLPPLAEAHGADVLVAEAGRDLYAETLAPLFDHGWAGLRALRRGNWKLVEGPTPELFDLARDPSESTNLWPTEEGTRLRSALAAVLARGGRPAAAAPLDAAAREALASLGYASAAREVPDDFGAGRPDPRRRMDVARELEAVAALAPADSGRALLRLAALARRDADNNLVFRRMAALRMARSEYDQAIVAYRIAGRLGYRGDDLAEALAEAYLRAGRARADAGDHEGARRRLAEARCLRPRRADVLHAIGVVEARAGRPEAALAAFRGAVEADPARGEAWFSTGLLLEKLGRTDEARAAYRRFLETSPGPSAEREHAERAAGSLGVTSR